MSKAPHRKSSRTEDKSGFDQFILDLARVTRVTQGGKHLSFRACVILGNRHGRVGYGVAKGKDVQLGVEKAVNQAKKHMITVPIVKDTIPHMVVSKFKAAAIMLKPAPRGSGIIAGGATRVVLELAGIPNVSAKILGKTKNKISVAKATFEALQSFKKTNATMTKKSSDNKTTEMSEPVVKVEETKQ
ncbi:MAG TPA: 30S ribosomal protein S5 [Patescibacteria group bacterium]|nr:30S ribosomal protein S5 [Patescibacteria group bacterium]